MIQKNDESRAQRVGRDGNTISRRGFIMGAALGTAGLLAGAGPMASAKVQLSNGATQSGPKPARPDISRHQLIAPNKVVQTHHAGAWQGEPPALNPGAVREMLDASIAELTGLKNVTKAWAALFKPEEHIAIKVNTLFRRDCTHAALVMAVTESLQAAGIPAEHITIFDRSTEGLSQAGYPVNTDQPGVRCHGHQYTGVWTISGTLVRLSDVLLGCDALINMPILTGITFFGAGITFAMKNHFGTFDLPRNFHGERFVTGLTELNALPPIKDRTRLVIGDILTPASYRSAYGRLVVGGDSILMSYDPVAHDAVGAKIADAAYAAEGREAPVAVGQAAPWLKRAAELGLGMNAPEQVKFVEIKL